MLRLSGLERVHASLVDLLVDAFLEEDSLQPWQQFLVGRTPVEIQHLDPHAMTQAGWNHVGTTASRSRGA